MSRARLPFVLCIILTTTPSLAQSPPCLGSPSEVEACQHVRHDALKAQRDAANGQQRAAGEAEHQRLQAAEDARLAPLRARIGPGFRGGPCVDLPKEANFPTTSPFESELPVSEHDTLEAVAADRANSAQLRVTFDALRCYALHRTRGVEIDHLEAQAANDPSGGIASALGIYQRLVARVPDLEPKLRADMARREAQDVRDEQCIGSPACMTKRFADRAANAACDAIAMHAAAQAEIASEKSYGRQSGAVDLVKLHDLGDELRSSDEQLAAAKAQYLELTKKPFNRGLCGR